MQPMEGLLLVVVLGATVLVGTTIGQRYSVAPPVLLITFGVLLALIPGLSHVHLPSDVVLLLFLPAILYWESLNTSIREIRANLRIIVFLSVALVIVTAVAVSWTARALGMESHAASVLGGGTASGRRRVLTSALMRTAVAPWRAGRARRSRCPTG